MVLVDTSVWSLALRRKAADLSVRERVLAQILYQLIQEAQVQLLGSIRQEVLSGIRDKSVFDRIREHLGDFQMFSWIDATTRTRPGSATHVGVLGWPVPQLIC